MPSVGSNKAYSRSLAHRSRPEIIDLVKEQAERATALTH